MKSVTHAFLLAAGAFCLFAVSPAGRAQDNQHRNRAISRLMDEGGWSAEACGNWWRVNERRFLATFDVAPDQAEKELRLLCRMQPKGKVLRLIEKHPETAGLLLLAHKRDALAAAILDAPEPDQNMLVASFLFSTTGTEVDEWTQAVARHPGPIALFQKRCAALPYSGLFSYLSASSLPPEAREVYGKWLDEVLALPVISHSDERMLSRFTFAATCGAELRRRLQSDPAFRQSFLNTVWPRFRNSMIDLIQSQGDDSVDVFVYCGGEPLVWDFFKRPGSEILFRQAGMDAVLMLEGKGPDALHSNLKDIAAAMWAKGILTLPRQMQEYQGNPHFLSLARRLGAETDWPMLNAVCIRLFEKSPEWPAEAAYLESLSSSSLNKEIHPKEPSMIPGAALVSLGEKFVDGRRAGFGDWLGAGFEAGEIVLVFFTLGSSKAVTTAARSAVQQTLKTGAKQSAEKLAGRTLKELTKKQSTDWPQTLAQEALKSLPGKLRREVVNRGVVDITDLVKTGFQISRNFGMGREPFKRFTGLEARVFMRQDGRVFINFSNVIVANPGPALIFLTSTFENGVLVFPPVGEGVSEAAAQFHQWKENVSAWWTGHASEQLLTRPSP